MRGGLEGSGCVWGKEYCAACARDRGLSVEKTGWACGKAWRDPGTPGNGLDSGPGIHETSGSGGKQCSFGAEAGADQRGKQCDQVCAASCDWKGRRGWDGEAAGGGD